MTDLKKLKVSLTKHGAHKVVDLLEQVDLDQVLQSTWATVPGIKIDLPQARKTLSAVGAVVPSLWIDARELPREQLRGIVLIGIVFSHWVLIEAMSQSITGRGVGTVRRASVDGGKGFTNTRDEFRKLGFVTKESLNEFDFDIRVLLDSKKAGPLTLKLLQTKLITAQWDRKIDPIDECIRVSFHRPFGMDADDFRNWASGGETNLDAVADISDPDVSTVQSFGFVAGHKNRKEGEVRRVGHGGSATARLLHNQYQTVLFNHMSRTHGKHSVGTEIKSGPVGTSVDLVLEEGGEYIFYEIKTSQSIRGCIRDALPQLLEYSYWPSEDRAKELVIISTNKPTKDAKAYLASLRKKFELPVYHETLNPLTGSTSDRV